MYGHCIHVHTHSVYIHIVYINYHGIIALLQGIASLYTEDLLWVFSLFFFK